MALVDIVDVQPAGPEPPGDGLDEAEVAELPDDALEEVEVEAEAEATVFVVIMLVAVLEQGPYWGCPSPIGVIGQTATVLTELVDFILLVLVCSS